MNKTAIALLALLASSASLAATPWQKITQPVPGSAQSIGSFSNGCIVGADTLPIQSEHYQVMRTDQRRYFGHPDLVMFIQRLSSGEQSGHGYGADWRYGDARWWAFQRRSCQPPDRTGCRYLSATAETRWTSAQLLRPRALDLVSRDCKHVVSLWKPEIFSLIKLPPDKDVTRIFVNWRLNNNFALMRAPIATGCAKATRFQHRAHMHTITCPADSLECEDQPLPHQAMVAGQNCKAGLNLQNREQQSLRRRHRLRCRLPARRYWMST